jgi:peroxiredoxin Q/BCP
MLKAGDKAPKFDLPSDSGKALGLASFPGKHVVVYFYPRDNTPGCTREAQAFAESARAIGAAGAVVVGISKDSIASHCKFRDQYRLNFPLLSDADLAVHKAFGAYGEKTMYGKKVLGTIRSTFIVDPAGKVAKVFPSVKVDGHAEAVLAAIHELRGGAKPAKSTKPAPKPKKSGARAKSAAVKAPAKKAAPRKTASSPKKPAARAR